MKALRVSNAFKEDLKRMDRRGHQSEMNLD